MDLLSNAEDKEKEKKQKGSHNQSQKSQQQKQKQQGAAGSKKEEKREVVEDIIVPQKAYLLGKEKSKKQHSKMADGKGEAGAATADKLGTK